MAVASKPAKKSFLKSPVFITAVAAGLVYAYVLNTTPSTTTAHRITHAARHSLSTNDGGITEQDLTAHFARYMGGAKDPFVPAVALQGAQTPAIGGSNSQWTLNGINTVDGVTTANIESSNGDSFFVKAGDTWNGLKVIAIKQDSVVFLNSLGQQTSLSFPVNDVTGPSTAGSAVASTSSTPSTGTDVPSAPPLPNFSLRPMPVPGAPGGGGRRNRDSSNTDDQAGGNQDNSGQ